MSEESRNAAVDLDFGGGSYRFRLAMGELEELQEVTGAGPYHCLRRLLAGDWHVQDVRDTIRLGLIGGGLSANEALKLTRRYVDERPDWIRNATLAIAALSAALAGAPEEQPSKKGGAPKVRSKARRSRTGASPSVRSTEPPPPSA
ncbi:MAG TPA: gene transfer agent family protein [Bosea sp. (in: a-proteobacteria)]|jgi:hypothetical protein|nr:gene transfer agent family protein [Bosea sp. (in: a-proteobacteria)]